MKLQIVHNSDQDSEELDDFAQEPEALAGELDSAVSLDGFVVFERGAVWPQTLIADLAGRRGVVVMCQAAGESHSDLLERVRRRVQRVSEPVGHLVWLGSAATQVPWEELLRALFATDEFGPQCVFSAFSGDGAAVLGLEQEDLLPEPVAPPRLSTVRATKPKPRKIAESA